MSKTETAPQTEAEEYHTLTPVEYVKYANAREHRAKHAMDLQHFMTFYRERQGHQGISEGTVGGIIEDYLDSLGPKA